LIFNFADPPLPYLRPMIANPKDTEADKVRKQKEHEREVEELSELKRKREPGLMLRFEDIIERVRRSRNERVDLKYEVHIPKAKSDLHASGNQIRNAIL